MPLSLNETHQAEMRHAYYDGAPGILVSGLVWLTSAFVCYQHGANKGMWALLIGGALIHPLGLLVTKLLGRPAKTEKGNALNQLAVASTVWLILCCAMSYGLSFVKPELFFYAMMATIGSRYLVLASVFGKSIFWLLGGALIIAANLALFMHFTSLQSLLLCGLIEIVFAALVFSKASKSTA